MSHQRFDDHFIGEEPVLTFNFTDELSDGETIVSVDGGAWGIKVLKGADADPASRLSGSPAVNGNQVSQHVLLTEANVTYQLHCTVLTDKPQKLTGVATLTVNPL